MTTFNFFLAILAVFLSISGYLAGESILNAFFCGFELVASAILSSSPSKIDFVKDVYSNFEFWNYLKTFLDKLYDSL